MILVDRLQSKLSELRAFGLSDDALASELRRRRLPRRRRCLEPGAALKASLWQHPVGQGFFHSGTIQLSERVPFRYVYDCGKLPGNRWATILGPTVTEYQRRPIDALFISHFDSDHVNGLTELLRAFDGALRAFLPYLHPARRLMIAAREAERDAPLTDDYLDFLDNPGDWLAARGVREIIYVGGEGGEGDGGFPRVPEVPLEGDDRRVNLTERRAARLDLRTTKDPLARMSVVEREQVFKREEGAAPTPVRFMDCRDPVVLHAEGEIDVAWVFQTYVEPDDALETEIKNAIVDAFSTQAHADLLSGTLACASILGDKKQRSKLAGAYRRATKAAPSTWKDALFRGRKARGADRSCMNRSTMSMYSGPWFGRAPSRRQPLYQSFDNDSGEAASHWEQVERTGRSGWLLTGDAVLSDTSVMKHFESFFGGPQVNWLEHVQVLTIPHHGSEANFSDELLCRLGVPPIAVVPAGAKTHYRHPSNDVMAAIRNHGVAVAHVHTKSGGGFFHHIASF